MSRTPGSEGVPSNSDAPPAGRDRFGTHRLRGPALRCSAVASQVKRMLTDSSRETPRTGTAGIRNQLVAHYPALSPLNFPKILILKGLGRIPAQITDYGTLGCKRFMWNKLGSGFVRLLLSWVPHCDSVDQITIEAIDDNCAWSSVWC